MNVGLCVNESHTHKVLVVLKLPHIDLSKKAVYFSSTAECYIPFVPCKLRGDHPLLPVQRSDLSGPHCTDTVWYAAEYTHILSVYRNYLEFVFGKGFPRLWNHLYHIKYPDLPH